MKQYRMVKVSNVSGYDEYQIQRKNLWWWDFVYGHWRREKVTEVLDKLRNGAPEQTITLIK